MQRGHSGSHWPAASPLPASRRRAPFAQVPARGGTPGSAPPPCQPRGPGGICGPATGSVPSSRPQLPRQPDQWVLLGPQSPAHLYSLASFLGFLVDRSVSPCRCLIEPSSGSCPIWTEWIPLSATLSAGGGSGRFPLRGQRCGRPQRALRPPPRGPSAASHLLRRLPHAPSQPPTPPSPAWCGPPSLA